MKLVNSRLGLEVELSENQVLNITVESPVKFSEVVYHICRQAGGEEGEFILSDIEKEEKHEMVSLLKEEVTIGNRNEYLTNAIKIYTRSVFDALNDNDVSQIKFYRTNEL